MICPVCRANNDTGPACRRCKADLSMLFELDAHRGVQLATAQALLGDEAACTAAQGADDIRRGADALQLLAVAALMCGNHARAWQAYQRVRTDR
jgi:hypothetical protein